MTRSGLRLGDVIPNFPCETSNGPLNIHEYKEDSWLILFSHPDDFTPVCTTELGYVAKLESEWAKRNVKVIGLSCNTLDSHTKWIADINSTQGCNLKFPIIADKDRTIATKLDMYLSPLLILFLLGWITKTQQTETCLECH